MRRGIKIRRQPARRESERNRERDSDFYEMDKSFSPQTLLILGRSPAISIREISAVFPHAKIIAQTDEFAVWENLPELDLRRIGGIVKVGRVFARTQNWEEAYDFLAEKFADQSGKQIFGISVFPENPRALKTLLIGAKKFLKERGIASRFANKDFHNLSSAQTTFEVLKENGVELLAAVDGRRWWLAELAGVQPFASYESRDYGKPARDARTGMLPPKLAQMMLNLALRDSPRRKVYDPFCGTGTVLVEAALLGCPALGSDIESRMVEFSRQNLAALELPGEVFAHDATQKVDQKFDVVVTEGDLGPPRRTVPDARARGQIFLTLKNLYEKFFGWLDCERAVICFPVYLEKGRPRFFASAEILPAIRRLGWKVQNSEKLIYARANQTVGREIAVLEKN